MPIEQLSLIAAVITVLCLSVVIFGLYRRAVAIERRLQGRTPREPANRWCSSSLCEDPPHRRHFRTDRGGHGAMYADEPLPEDAPRLRRRRRSRGWFGFGDGLEGHLDYLERLGGGR